MYKKFLFHVSVIFILMCSFGCNKKDDPARRPGVPVVSTKAVTQDVHRYIESVGCCRSYASVNIVPQVYGTLQSVHFEQGAHIKTGDLLYTIDPVRYEAALNQAKAKVIQAKAQLEVDSARLERSKALLPQNYISQQEYETLDAQVLQDKAAIVVAQSVLEQAELDFQHCSITSPIDGIAGKYLIDVGNVLPQSATGSVVLVNIQDVEHLYIDFSVSENLFPKLYKNFTRSGDGLDVSVSLIADDTVTGTAKLNFLENTINKHTGSIELRAVLDNDVHKFWPGAAVNVKVLLKTKKDAVLVPSECVRLGQSGYYAFIIKDDKSAELRTVKIGQQYGELIRIKEGIKSGENVVCTGQLMLAPGMKVTKVPDPRKNEFQAKLKTDKELIEKNPTTK